MPSHVYPHFGTPASFLFHLFSSSQGTAILALLFYSPVVLMCFSALPMEHVDTAVALKGGTEHACSLTLVGHKKPSPVDV